MAYHLVRVRDRGGIWVRVRVRVRVKVRVRVRGRGRGRGRGSGRGRGRGRGSQSVLNWPTGRQLMYSFLPPSCRLTLKLCFARSPSRSSTS